jgi:hypothetical protein
VNLSCCVDICIYIRPVKRTVTFFSAFVQTKYEYGMIKHHIRFHPHRPHYLCCGQPWNRYRHFSLNCVSRSRRVDLTKLYNQALDMKERLSSAAPKVQYDLKCSRLLEDCISIYDLILRYLQTVKTLTSLSFSLGSLVNQNKSRKTRYSGQLLMTA